VRLRLITLPEDTGNPERVAESHIVRSFLSGVGKYQPQVVGFNSINADLKIVVQRAAALGVQAKEFCTRPNKPWEGNDYFARGQDCNVDLMDIYAGFGRTSGISLNEMAVVCGIPGKLGTSGDDVAGMWMRGELDAIVHYNQFDAFTTYLLWLRTAYVAGHFTAEQYKTEQRMVQEYLEQLIAGGSEHLQIFLGEWHKLRTLRGLDF
jgi:hypothetical protein